MAPSPLELHREGVFRRDGAVCEKAHLGNCGGRLQSDHVISKQAIKHARARAALQRRPHPLLEVGLDAILADPRNGRVRCEIHHHNPHLTETRADLAAHVEAFAEDYDLVWRLDRDFGPLEAAA